MQSPVSTPAVQPEVLAEVQPEVLVAALYQFAPFDDPQALREPLLAFCAAQGIKGTLLLADEGINGTVAGPAGGIPRSSITCARCPIAPGWRSSMRPRRPCRSGGSRCASSARS